MEIVDFINSSCDILLFSNFTKSTVFLLYYKYMRLVNKPFMDDFVYFY